MLKSFVAKDILTYFRGKMTAQFHIAALVSGSFSHCQRLLGHLNQTKASLIAYGFPKLKVQISVVGHQGDSVGEWAIMCAAWLWCRWPGFTSDLWPFPVRLPLFLSLLFLL